MGEPKNEKPFTTPVGGKAFSAATATADFARTLVGIKEQPLGSNDGAQVRLLQSSTGQYRAPWCVSTIQYICLKVDGKTIADKTAGAYYLRNYARKSGWVVPKPQVGAFVVYQIGEGHAGTVVAVHPDGTFEAVEGNYNNACEIVHRNPKVDRCTFIVPPWQR